VQYIILAFTQVYVLRFTVVTRYIVRDEGRSEKKTNSDDRIKANPLAFLIIVCVPEIVWNSVLPRYIVELDDIVYIMVWPQPLVLPLCGATVCHLRGGGECSWLRSFSPFRFSWQRRPLTTSTTCTTPHNVPQRRIYGLQLHYVIGCIYKYETLRFFT